jgi:serine/threonine protein kinase
MHSLLSCSQVLFGCDDLKQLIRTDMHLEDFFVGRIIGKGSFGQVNICQHKSTGKVVAIKAVKKLKLQSTITLNQLKNEKQILSTIENPFIVKLIGSFQDNRNVYLIFEYIPGGEVFNLLKTRKKLSKSYVKFIATEITVVLLYLHSVSIVYRDLKPENILISADGHIKLIDFGLATYITQGKLSKTFCGTLEYLAPEMIDRTGHDYSLDWWTLGVLLYEMIFGFPPFISSSNTQLFEKIRKTVPVFPNDFDYDTKDLIEKLLVKDPRKRMPEGSIKDHRYFGNVNWEDAEKRLLAPTWVPTISCEMDTSYYDIYTESNDYYCKVLGHIEGF